MKVFKFSLDRADQRCPGCRWPSHNLYVLAESQESAKQLHRVNKTSLCGDCLCEIMADSGHTVESPKHDDSDDPTVSVDMKASDILKAIAEDL